MALTRRYLRGLGLTEAQIDGVISAHAETVEGLKGEIEALRGDAEQLSAVQRELDARDDWKAKHDQVAQAFDAYRAEAERRQREADVKAAYLRLLEQENIDPRRYDVILRATDFSGMALDEAGGLQDAEALSEAIRREWADFIVTRERRGARVQTPQGTGRRGMSRGDILAIRDPAERQRAIAENHEIFGF